MSETRKIAAILFSATDVVNEPAPSVPHVVTSVVLSFQPVYL
jgi:hypothetical protein